VGILPPARQFAALIFFSLRPLRIHSPDVGFSPEAQNVGVGFLLTLAWRPMFALLWYSWFVRYNRRRAEQRAGVAPIGLPGRGRLSDVEWQASSSRLKATLHLASRWFDDASVTICLLPRRCHSSGR